MCSSLPEVFTVDQVKVMARAFSEESKQTYGILRGKFVLGTAVNTTENERNQIETKLGFRDVNPESKIIDCDCLKLLRDHLI